MNTIIVVFQFEININVLVNSLRSIWIPMVYGSTECEMSLRPFSVDWSTLDVRIWRLQSIPLLLLLRFGEQWKY